jgi:hypothetical protein
MILFTRFETEHHKMIRKMKVFDLDFIASESGIREVPYLRFVFVIAVLFRKRNDLVGGTFGIFSASRDYDYMRTGADEKLVQSRES